jgi:transcriptional regulator with XRE-family HTH domain
MPEFDTYSQRLRSARVAAGLTQSAVAKEAGEIAGTFVSAVERGAVERVVAVLDAALARRAQAGDQIALAARAQLPNVRSRSQREAGLAALAGEAH